MTVLKTGVSRPLPAPGHHGICFCGARGGLCGRERRLQGAKGSGGVPVCIHCVEQSETSGQTSGVSPVSSQSS